MNIPDQLRGCSQAPSPSPSEQPDPPPRQPSSKFRKPEYSHLWSCDESVTSVAHSAQFIYAGTISGKINVYDLETYQCVGRFDAHSSSILTMLVQESGGDSYLFSGSSDSLVKMWLLPDRSHDQATAKARLNYTVYCLSDVGDIFSMAFLDGVLYLGTQNASVHWIDLAHEKGSHPKSSKSKPKKGFDMHPAVRPNRFFDSAGPGGRLAPQQKETKKLLQGQGICGDSSLLEIPLDNQIAFAHDSAVYAMAVDAPRRRIITGSGDGTIKIWKADEEGCLVEIYKINVSDAILDMALVSSWQLCCGLDASALLVLDLDTLQVLRHDLPEVDGAGGPLLALTAVEDGLFVSRGSQLIAFDASTSAIQTWSAPGLVTDAITLPRDPTPYPFGSTPLGNLITTGQDGSIVLWSVPLGPVLPTQSPVDIPAKSGDSCSSRLNGSLSDLDAALPTNWENQKWDPNSNETMIEVLARLIRHETVSSRDRKHWSDCRRCSTEIRDIFRLLGAEADLLRVEGGNPIVWAQFSANTEPSSAKRGRILFYGHYDVIEANETASSWKTPPFQLTSIDGYMYGRGVTDNKGPFTAAMFAVAGLYARGELTNDVVFLIEGEEECGSFGFRSTVQNHLNKIGNIDWIIFSNSYWLNDTIPCLNYGLRGVVFAEIDITSGKADLHSGVDGGLFREPAQDMINLLSRLTKADTGEIIIPNFFDSVLEVSDEEQKLYEDIVKSTPSVSIKDLIQRWRYPSLTVHKLEVSGPGNQTVIPASMKAYISLRLVPDQTASEIKQTLERYLNEQFAQFNSTNRLNIRFKYDADPWIGNPKNDGFQILYKALKESWGISPLYIREGGSVPVARALEKIFAAPAVQLPCGQSSDGAHLDNERLRITNLLNARKVFERIFVELKAK